MTVDERTYTLHTRKSTSSDHSNGEVMSMVEDEPELTFFEKIKEMDGWVSFWVLLIGGFLFIASPAIIIMSFYPEYRLSLLLSESVADLVNPVRQVVRFSSWLSLSWAAFICIRFYILVMPGILVRFITNTYGELSESVKMRLEYIPAVRFWLTNALWMVASVILYRIIFFQMTIVSEWADIFNAHVMLMWFSIVLLAQRMFVQKIATDFHKVAYQERIKESKKALKVLEKLKKSLHKSGLAALFETDTAFDDESTFDVPEHDTAPKANLLQKIFRKRDGSKEKSDDVVIQLEESNFPKTSSPRPTLSRKRTVVREESSTKTFNQFLSIGTRKRKPGFTSHLSSDQYALEFADKLYKSLFDTTTGIIQLETFYKYFDSPKEAQDAFAMFDRDGNGSVSKSELRRAVLRIYREKRNLQESMIDLSHALGNLNQILYVISMIVAVLLSLPIYGISISAVLPFTSILVALSFIFGGSARSTFDCIVFLFVTHPFDTGDRVIIDGTPYVVEEMSILNTVLVTDGKRTYFPNTALMQKMIVNVRRSGDMTDYVEIKIDLYTPEEKLKELQNRMIGYVKEHGRSFRPLVTMNINVMQTNFMVVQFSLELKGNWQDGGKRLTNRTNFMLALKKHVIELDIRIADDSMANFK